MRETKYARELCEPGLIQFTAIEEGRIERIFVKPLGQEEIRFSAWKNGKMLVRPLDLMERDLLRLLADALSKDVFSQEFRADLRSLL